MLQVGFKDWLRDLLLWVPRKIWELMLDGLASVIEAIPVPSWLADAGDAFSGLPSGVLYFVDALNLGAGMTIILGAYVLRFLIRRLPVIG